MLSKRNFLFIVALFAFTCVIPHAQKLNHLKSWADEIPIDCARKPCRSIFNLPEVRQPLLKLLGTKNFKRATTYERELPIDIIDGYLVIEGFVREPYEHVVIAIRLSGAVMHVGFGSRERPEWYSSAGKASELPDCVRRRLE